MPELDDMEENKKRLMELSLNKLNSYKREDLLQTIKQNL